MNLGRRDVRVRLSKDGRAALVGVQLPVEPIPFRVEKEDQHGIWVHVGSVQTGESESEIPVMLLKWEHIATISLDWAEEPGHMFEIVIENPRK